MFSLRNIARRLEEEVAIRMVAAGNFPAQRTPELRPLPERPYEFAFWKKAKVHLDYHVQVESAFYSVPYALIGQRVDVRVTAHGIEVTSIASSSLPATPGLTSAGTSPPAPATGPSATAP